MAAGPEARRDAGRGRRAEERREQRAQRILDAAAELVLRWGYDKTTIDDVARAAGVAKGTIYLHWKTREELFTSLLRRDRAELAAEVERGVTGDGAAATLRGVLERVMLALVRRPLLKAVLLRDMEVIGKLARARQDEQGAFRRDGFVGYLRTLREHDLVRTDISLTAQVHLVSAVFLGFLNVPSMLPREWLLPDEQVADLLAETVDRTLDRGRPLVPDEAARLAAATLRYADDLASTARAKYHTSLGVSVTEERT